MKTVFLGCLNFFLIFVSACDGNMFGPNILTPPIKFRGEKYEIFNSIPLTFNNDTIYPEIWFRTLNVDGDNKRLLLFSFNGDTTIFSLANAVNNYTDITCYSIRVDKNRYLWIEDNFGRTVVDIDRKILMNIKKSHKVLNEIAPTGAPIGVKHPISVEEIKSELDLGGKSKLLILDSLTFIM